ncbi:MAG: hypothetical protein E7392_03280 [Ruminococcaceae bacterium]|nr:hypothetical protein [Oscillospiraceae bacterium]
MLFFVICACFALFPAQVLAGAQSGLALCINAVIPSLLPFMLFSACIIKSNFSRPLGAALSKVLSPITGMSPDGCVCFITGLLGGYGAGARAVLESYNENHISEEEAQRLLAFCNNAGPLFIMGTVGVGFFSSKSVGAMLFFVQVVTAIICARIFSGDFKKRNISVKEEWDFYKKNKPPIGGLITKSAIESGSAIITACVFVIAFSAILEILPFGSYSLLTGVLEVTRGTAEMSRQGMSTLPVVSAILSWGGMSVHFQANALCDGKFRMNTYYVGKILASMISFLITKLVCGDTNIFLLTAVLIIALLLIGAVVRFLFSPKFARQHVFRQRRHS